MKTDTNFVEHKKDLAQRIKDGEFDSRLEYPEYFKKPRLPEIKVTDTVEKILELKTKFDNDEIAFKNGFDIYERERKECNADKARLEALFQKALEENCGVTGHSKAGMLYGIAYDYGHGGGFLEIYHNYIDLVDLIKPD